LHVYDNYFLDGYLTWESIGTMLSVARGNYLSTRKHSPSHLLHKRDTMNIPPFNFDNFPFSQSTFLLDSAEYQGARPRLVMPPIRRGLSPRRHLEIA
jgi:hypothetical protein